MRCRPGGDAATSWRSHVGDGQGRAQQVAEDEKGGVPLPAAATARQQEKRWQTEEEEKEEKEKGEKRRTAPWGVADNVKPCRVTQPHRRRLAAATTPATAGASGSGVIAATLCDTMGAKLQEAIELCSALLAQVQGTASANKPTTTTTTTLASAATDVSTLAAAPSTNCLSSGWDAKKSTTTAATNSAPKTGTSTAAAAAAPPESEHVQQFNKAELAIGRVISVECVENSDKLYRCQIEV